LKSGFRQDKILIGNFKNFKKEPTQMNKTTERKSNQVKTIHSLLDPQEIQVEMFNRCKEAALKMGVALLEEEVNALCGASFSRKSQDQCHRGGSEKTQIIVGGGKSSMLRPRVRKDGKEVELTMLDKLQKQDLLDEKIQGYMLSGVSSRNYKKLIDGYSDKLGISKSSVSRAFIRESKKDLESINESDLSDHRFVALFVDSFEIFGRAMVVALGVNSEMKKVILGIRDGNSENSDVVTDLLSSIKTRKFTLAAPVFLAIVDGSKALKKAINSVFGDSALIQRCWIHKLRNIKKYIPDKYHGTLHWRMKKLMNLESLDEAVKELQSLAKWLSEISHAALVSLEESGNDLLTLHSLGVKGKLRQKFTTTNIIESIISVARSKINRVKKWNPASNQSLRWTASALFHHKTKLRCVVRSDYGKLLISALHNYKIEKLAA
jgi:putative transposase